MPPDKARQERFARALAAGRTVAAAAEEAGYASSSWPNLLSRRPDFRERVAAIAMVDPITGPALGPVIAALMSGADEAMKKGTAGAFNAAARMLAEAGRLKQKLPTTPSGDTLSAWAERWGPED
ncbi:MAG TPA: hypothetical protein VGF71_15615 [Caulobacteraceae bacterium]|jgi:hypothetical protein